MEAHVLNGDALAEKFPLKETIIVFRGALIEGPVKAESFDSFWKMRAAYLAGASGEKENNYYNGVRDEIEKLKTLTHHAAVNLWFEHDLFCQANMWFVLHYLSAIQTNLPLYLVMPPAYGEHIWSGFGPMDEPELKTCYDRRIEFSETDIRLGVDLWQAYQSGEVKKLKALSLTLSPCFPLLKEVCEAHIQRYPEKGIGRPQQKLKQILGSGVTDFHQVFQEFRKTEGIYGFGDLQVKNMLSTL